MAERATYEHEMVGVKHRYVIEMTIGRQTWALPVPADPSGEPDFFEMGAILAAASRANDEAQRHYANGGE